MTRRNSLKIAHPWLTFKYGEGHSYQNMTPSWSLFSCSVIYFVITSLRPLRLYHNYIGTRGMYRSGLHFFFYKTGSVFRTVSQISISSFHKSGINIISIFHLSLPPLSVLAPQHVILKNFQACISCPPPPNFYVLFFISYCSHACCIQLLLSGRIYVWQVHLPSISLVNACSRQDFTQRDQALFPDG